MKTLQEIQQMAESNTWTNSNGKTVQVNHARESSKQAIKKAVWENIDIKAHRQMFESKFGFDYADRNAFPVHESNFDWNTVAKKCGYPTIRAAFKEADSGSSFVQVLRAGVQTLVNSLYETVPTTYESWVTTVNSNKDTELYAPLHGVSFLREVGKQQLYPENHAAGLDIKLVNRKYGVIFAVERELLEDDQTGQFAKQMSLLAEYCKLAQEVLAYGKLAGLTGSNFATYSTMEVPHSETQPANETNYPWSTSLQGGGRNRPDTYGALNQTNIQAGFIGLMNQKNLLGLKMSVDPNRLVIGPHWRFDAAVLLNSSFYPSQPGAAGTTGTSFAINPIESIAALTVSRFVFDNTGSVDGNSKAWYLMDDKKPWFVGQLRTGPEVIQEAPNSGQAFERDIVRFRCDTRINADFIDPRFAWQGNDGSV